MTPHGKRKCAPTNDNEEGIKENKKIAVSIDDATESTPIQRNENADEDTDDDDDDDHSFVVMKNKKDNRANSHYKKADVGVNRRDPKFAAYMRGIECNYATYPRKHHVTTNSSRQK